MTNHPRPRGNKRDRVLGSLCPRHCKGLQSLPLAHPGATSKPQVGGSNPSGRTGSYAIRRDNLVTSVRRALEAVTKGEPTALRMAVEALGETLDLLADQDADAAEDPPSREAKERAR